MSATDGCRNSASTSEVADHAAQALPDGPVNAPASQHACRSCRPAGRPIARKTMLLMLKPEKFGLIGAGEYRFCPNPECSVVYFTEGDGEIFTTEELRLRVGLKVREDPIPLCYCFGFDEADVRAEIARAGRTSIPERIAALLIEGMCACLERNPSGACCLGEVNKAVRRLIKDLEVNQGESRKRSLEGPDVAETK